MLTELYSVAQRVSQKYGIFEHIPPGEHLDTVRYVEHTIHELAHGLTLRLDLDVMEALAARYWRDCSDGFCVGRNGLSDTVGRRLRRTHRLDIQVANERRTWSVEWNVLQHLPVLELDADFVIDEASVQGIQPWDRDLLFKQAKQPWAQRHASQILEMFSGKGKTL